MEESASGLEENRRTVILLLFDNAKVAVKDGFGAHAKKQAGYSALSAHYGFEAVFCNPASGNEKGLVEGLVGYIRRNTCVPVPRVNSMDELSYLSFNRHQSEMLFKVISDRSEKGSTIVTTNLPFSKWTDLFENTTMVAALIDPLIFRSHVLDMNEEAYRLKASLQGLEDANV